MASEEDSAPLTMLTFAPMVDSEMTRLVLAHYGVAYRERNHLMIKALLTTFAHGGYGRMPLLYGRGVHITSPRNMAEHYEPLAPPERRLMPSELKDQVEADWHTYNGKMAVHTAVFAYHHLLPLKELMSGIFASPLPPDEARDVRARYGGLEFVLRLALRPTAERAEKALGDIRATVDKTDARVADGRLYLCGDRATLGDLALASAAAPLLLPPGYGAKMPSVGLMPSPLRGLVEELRERPTGAFVKRLYAEGLPAARVPT
jgi:glutathione S-transferase